MTKTVTDEALELLKRCDAAMRNYFSSDFDGGESFSILTADIPEFLKRAASEQCICTWTGNGHSLRWTGDVNCPVHPGAVIQFGEVKA